MTKRINGAAALGFGLAFLAIPPAHLGPLTVADAAQSLGAYLSDTSFADQVIVLHLGSLSGQRGGLWEVSGLIQPAPDSGRDVYAQVRPSPVVPVVTQDRWWRDRGSAPGRTGAVSSDFYKE